MIACSLINDQWTKTPMVAIQTVIRLEYNKAFAPKES